MNLLALSTGLRGLKDTLMFGNKYIYFYGV